MILIFHSRPLLQPVLFLFLFLFKVSTLSLFLLSFSFSPVPSCKPLPLSFLFFCVFCSTFFQQVSLLFFLILFLLSLFLFYFMFVLFIFLLALASLSTYSIVYLFPCLVCPFVSLLSNRSFFSLSLGFPLFDALLMHVNTMQKEKGNARQPRKKAKFF